jgi:hypothetical protein
VQPESPTARKIKVGCSTWPLGETLRGEELQILAETKALNIAAAPGRDASRSNHNRRVR